MGIDILFFYVKIRLDLEIREKLLMKIFKKVLSTVLAFMTISGGVSVGAQEGSKLQKINNLLKNNCKAIKLAVAATALIAVPVGSGITIYVLMNRCFGKSNDKKSQSEGIKVGTPGQDLTKDDFKKYLKQERVKYDAPC